jgi:solute carrier family 25 (mitochondrial phosphate transporter), member 3
MWENKKHHIVPSPPSTSSLPATSAVAINDGGSSNHDNNNAHITTTDKVIMAGGTLATVLLFYALLSAGAAGSWRFYLAGGICAATSHAVPVPVDVIKTRQQIDASLENIPFMQAARSIVHTEGISALFLGMGPTVCGYFFEGSLKFGIYEVLKPAVQSLVSTRWMAYVLCGIVSGLVASVALCPMEALRIRLVSEPDYAGAGGNWIQGGLKMLKTEGVFGLCKGMNPMIAKQVPYTVTKNVSFDLMTCFAYSIIATRTAVTTFFIPLVAAAIASVLSCIASQPGDMLLSVINAHEGKQNTRDVAKQLWRSSSHLVGEGGGRRRGRRGQAFFVGMNTRFMHVGIIVTMQLLIYDMVKRLCGIAATGSV